MIEIDAQSCALTLDTEKGDRNFCYLMLIWLLLLLFYSFERNHRHQEFVRTAHTEKSDFPTGNC